MATDLLGRPFDVRTDATRDDWCTPNWLLGAVRRVGWICLDPCSNPQSMVGADLELMLEHGDDGLREDWDDLAGGGLVYCNPPYGDALLPWAKKHYAESMAGCEIIALVPARTETEWFERMRRSSDAACFLGSRVNFVGGPSGSTFPSVVFYSGAHRDRFADVFAEHGWVVTYPREPYPRTAPLWRD